MIRFVLIFFILIFFTNCQSMKDGIALKKKEAADEFLVEKKNPLVQPPEFSQLLFLERNWVMMNYQKIILKIF